MRIRRKSEAEVQERNRLRTYVLMDTGELGSRNLCVTWSEIEPGAKQGDHSHLDSEQVYVIIRGQGQVSVTGELQEIGEGDMIFIPPGTQHGLVNTGEEALHYVTAASPPFSLDELHRTQLAPEVDDFFDDES